MPKKKKEMNERPQMQWLLVVVVTIVVFNTVLPVIVLILAIIDKAVEALVAAMICLGIDAILCFSKQAEPIRNEFVEIIKRLRKIGAFDPRKSTIYCTDVCQWEDLFEFNASKKNLTEVLTGENYSKHSMQETLIFLEKILKKCIAKARYEISIFRFPDEPDIICYYDTGRNTRPDSHKKRQDNPNYYIECNYEAVKLLREPSNQVYIVPIVSKENYSYTSKKQRKHVKSQAMLCFNNGDYDPTVLVVAADKRNIFSDSAELIIQTCGAILYYDQYIGERFCDRKPEFDCVQDKRADQS